MVSSRRNHPSNVIALSPYRARLGRGRRLRRADALIDAPDLDAALVLILANHIGDLDVLVEAIALAKRRMLDASQQQQQQQQ